MSYVTFVVSTQYYLDKQTQTPNQTNKMNNLFETNPNDENVILRTQFVSKGRSGRVRI